MRLWLAQLPHSSLENKDTYGYTAMHYAAKFNRFKIMQLLVARGAGESAV